MLRTVEYLGAVASLESADYVYPTERIDRIWKTLLLNQFHDILPARPLNGSSRGPRRICPRS
mgnify:CR=1 FL=1